MSDTYSPVPELNLLNEFQDRVGFESYAAGFGLTDYADTAGLAAGWSTDPEALGRLIPFAQANGTGSEYALWRVDDRTDLATLPVVVFGDEGGEFVVARDLRELFQLLACDTEISAWPDEVYFHRDEDEYEPSDGHAEYVAWLAGHFGLAPVADPNAVIAAAQAEYGERFAGWAQPFLDAWLAGQGA